MRSHNPQSKGQLVRDLVIVQRAFLAIVYAEIQEAAREDPPSFNEGEAATLLRVSRTIVGLEQHPILRETPASKEGADEQINESLATFDKDMQEEDTVLWSHLRECITAFDFTLLSICLHSAEFRKALDAEIGQEAWQERLSQIQERRSSLELFALTRNLRYKEAIASSDAHFADVLSAMRTELENSGGKMPVGSLFGLHIGFPASVHSIEDNDRCPYTWRLPLDLKNGAEPTTITYENNAQLRKEFPNDKKQANFKRRQENIEESVVLFDKHQWGKKSQWPEQHPQYSGLLLDDKCTVCGAHYGLVAKDPRARRRNEINHPYPPCKCRLADAEMYDGTPVIELYTKEITGTSVRALQDIAKGQILDPYLGEIYPYERQQMPDNSRCRYGTGDPPGSSYVYTQAVSERHAKRKRSHSESTVTEDLDRGEVTSFAIDSAVKGNWTRYINHSCDPNTEFMEISIGSRKMPMLVAEKEIKFDEEITIFYSQQYFHNQRFPCRCEAPKCKLWNVENLLKNDVELKDAIANGTAPDWAMGKTDDTPTPAASRSRKTAKAAKKQKAMATTPAVKETQAPGGSAKASTETAAAKSSTETRVTRSSTKQSAKTATKTSTKQSTAKTGTKRKGDSTHEEGAGRSKRSRRRK
jgi:hypothetical protein